MSLFEITIQRRFEGRWPVVAKHQPGAGMLALWSQGVLELDPDEIQALSPRDKKYGLQLGRALFREEIRDAFVRALSDAGDAPTRVLLTVESETLRGLHWEQLTGPLDRGWDTLLLNQPTPFTLFMPTQIARRFPPIGRRDLRALILVAGPRDLEEDYQLEPFDVAATVESVQQSLGQIPGDVLGSVPEAAGPPTLEALSEQLLQGRHTLLHIVCHGRYLPDSGDTVLFFPDQAEGDPVTAQTLVTRLGRIQRLPHFTVLSTCESADPRAEAGLGGVGQRLVRELGMPAVLAMTSRVTIETAQALSSALYARLLDHGEVDRAVSEALVGLQGRYDAGVPALFGRLGGQPLFSEALDRPLSDEEIRLGLDKMESLLHERAPVLVAEFAPHAAKVRANLEAGIASLGSEAREEHEATLAAINQLSSEALDLPFNALALGQQAPEYDARCPFRGLQPFRPQDHEFFFGRDALVNKLAGRIREHPFLAVLGPSGSGKSSLVLAGLMPALQASHSGLEMVYLRPGSEPLATLDAALEEARTVESRNQLLVVDQFEELFTLTSQAEARQAFVDRLLSLSGATAGVVVTMRADFWGECASLAALRDEMQAHQELVAPMDAAALRRAMERQAAHVGLRFEAGLGDAILRDVQGEPGAMPLLQHALLLLWNKRHGRWLRWEEYRAIGGIRQAIAHTADEVYEELSPAERERMRDVLLRLTRVEDEGAAGEARDTRRRVRLSELVPSRRDPAPTVALVQRLADARLLVTGTNPVTGEDEVDVAHEALIRHWGKLRTWLNEDRTELRLRQIVREAADDWERHQKDESYLIHRGGRLELAETLCSHPRFSLSELEESYLSACIDLRERLRLEKEEQQRRDLEAAQALAAEQQARAESEAKASARIRKRAVVIGVVGIVAIVLAGLSLVLWAAARNNAQEARTNLALAVTNEAAANAASTRAVGNAATATANLATADVASTRAVANQATAEAIAGVARAQEVAAVASKLKDQELVVSLLLGIEAYRMEDLSQTRQALFDTWSHTPQLRQYLWHDDWVNGVAWSSDGRLATGSSDGYITIWGPDLGEPIDELAIDGGFGPPVTGVAWSENGWLAAGLADGSVAVWERDIGEPYWLESHDDYVNSIAWSPDGLLASASDDGTVVVWDADTDQFQTLEGHEARVTSVAWSPDGRLASGSEDQSVIVWDLQTSQPAAVLTGHEDWVTSVTWSAEGQLASGSWDQTIIVWDWEREQAAQSLDGGYELILSLAWSATGQLAAGSNDGSLIVWDLGIDVPPTTLRGHSDWVETVAWSPDGRLASGSSDQTAIVWELERTQIAQVLGSGEEIVQDSAWSPDNRLASASSDGTITLWDLNSSQPAQILEGHEGWVSSVAWSADGRLASGSDDSTVIVWDLAYGTPEETLEGHESFVHAVAWSDRGELASASEDGTIIVWDLAGGAPAERFDADGTPVLSLAWSGDGHLAAGTLEGRVLVWDAARASGPLRLLEHNGAVTGVGWSPTGQLASTSDDNTVIIWDLERGEAEKRLSDGPRRMTGLAWSASGQLATGGDAPSALYRPRVIVWDLELGLPAHILEGHVRYVTSVAWSSGDQLASASEDGTIHVWPMDPETWVAQSCQRANSDLTDDEWERYFPDEPYRATCF